MPTPSAERVRGQIVARFEKLQLPVGDGVLETILIRDGRYVGRRFRVDGAHAVWIDSEQQVRIWAESGELLEVFALDGAGPARDVA